MLELSNTDSIYNIADWIEYYILYKNKTLSKSKMRALLEDEDGIVKEEDIDSVFNEMTKRKKLYGDSSPFEVEGNSIRPKIKWKDNPELTMCLIFSIKGVNQKKGTNDGTKLFERLSREAIKVYLGGEAEVIGFPNKKNFRDQVKYLSEKMREEIGHRNPRPTDKDKGVDIIAWKPHGDMRPNQIVVLLQCGAGLNYSKKKSISIDAWHEFIHFSAKPVAGIMIPKIVSDEDWMSIRDDYNLIFDRIRIYKAVYNKPLSDKALKKQILDWCKVNLN